MKIYRIRSILAFVFFFGCSCLYGTDSLLLVTEDRPPRQTQVDGNIVGTAVDKVKLPKLEDVGRMSIGTCLGDSRDTFLKGLRYNVDTAPDDLKNIQKLKDHKIDLWAADEGSAFELL